MTIALCLNCGRTKFGALCPCSHCGAPDTGNADMDILFSDHNMDKQTLEAFGQVIQKIARQCDQDELRFWTFMLYLSDHPSDLLTVEPPPELAADVRALLASLDLPQVAFELKERPDDEAEPQPVQEIDLPEELVEAFRQANPSFQAMADVQFKDRHGNRYPGLILEQSDGSKAMVFRDPSLPEDDLIAFRKTPGRLLGWLIRPKWITSEELA